MNNDFEHGIKRIREGEEPPVPDEIKLRKEVDMAVDKARYDYEQANNTKISLYDFVADKCNITSSLYKKLQNPTRPNKWTRAALGKLCVGLGLTIDEANELFQLQGGKLNETNALDKIIYCALRDKDDISFFCGEVLQYTGKDIESLK